MRISGEVLYNGHAAGEFNVQRTCALVAQQDCHVPVLTVDETLAFAALCQVGAGGGPAQAAGRRRRGRVCATSPPPTPQPLKMCPGPCQHATGCQTNLAGRLWQP
jgi:hypothetical protein